MKKIITGIAAVAMAASLFAVDFSATVKVKGDIAYGDVKENSSSVNFLAFENTTQQDADLLEVHFSGDRAGADFKFWTTLKGDSLKLGDASGNLNFTTGDTDPIIPVSMRAMKVWFKPIDQLNISLGHVGLYLYTERVNWWKVPMAGSVSQFSSWEGRWSSAAGLKENVGLTVEVTPIDGLYIGAGVAPGVNAGTFQFESTKNGNTTTTTDSYLAWGAVAKYTFSDLGLSIGAAYRDDGKDNLKLLTVGADFGVDSFYGFLQGKLNFDDHSDGNYSFAADKYGMTLRGVTIDNYFEYNFGFMKLQATLPVTIRGLVAYDTDAEKKADPSYMTARIKATIPLNAISAYAIIGSDEGHDLDTIGQSAGGSGMWTFNDTFGDTFNMYIKPGVSFNVGVCALDIGVELSFANMKAGNDVKTNFAWAVPFSATVAF